MNEKLARLRTEILSAAVIIKREWWIFHIFVVLPFIAIALLILNQRVVAVYDQLSELRQDATRHEASARTLISMQTQLLEDRISELERIIFVDVKNQLNTRPLSAAALWQRERDAELRKRLLALERWRLEQGR